MTSSRRRFGKSWVFGKSLHVPAAAFAGAGLLTAGALAPSPVQGQPDHRAPAAQAPAHAAQAPSDNAPSVIGRKWPNSPRAALTPPGLLAPRASDLGALQDLPQAQPGEDWDRDYWDSDEPVDTSAEIPRPQDLKDGFNDLLPYVMPSPDQKDAGSCLYMATTGAAEWWLLKRNPETARTPDGPADLSERFTMNLADRMNARHRGSWLTDSILLFNSAGGALANKDYRFTMGWYRPSHGKIRPADPGDFGASYGTPFNWISDSFFVGGNMIPLPRFDRAILHAEPKGDQWAVNSTPLDIVEQVKTALRERQAPVLVVYNHYGIWHTVMIVGYNDHADSRGCTFTRRFPLHMRAQARLLEDKGLFEKAAYFRELGESVKDAYQAAGGCPAQGMFYVRDSIYPDPKGPVYDYDPAHSGEESSYAAPVILREYAWLERLANHVVQILAQ